MGKVTRKGRRWPRDVSLRLDWARRHTEPCSGAATPGTKGTRLKVLRSHVVTSVPRSWTDTAETTLRQSTGMTTMFWMTRSFRQRAFGFSHSP